MQRNRNSNFNIIGVLPSNFESPSIRNSSAAGKITSQTQLCRNNIEEDQIGISPTVARFSINMPLGRDSSVLEELLHQIKTQAKKKIKNVYVENKILQHGVIKIIMGINTH